MPGLLDKAAYVEPAAQPLGCQACPLQQAITTTATMSSRTSDDAAFRHLRRVSNTQWQLQRRTSSRRDSTASLPSARRRSSAAVHPAMARKSSCECRMRHQIPTQPQDSAHKSLPSRVAGHTEVSERDESHAVKSGMQLDPLRRLNMQARLLLAPISLFLHVAFTCSATGKHFIVLPCAEIVPVELGYHGSMVSRR